MTLALVLVGRDPADYQVDTARRASQKHLPPSSQKPGSRSAHSRLPDSVRFRSMKRALCLVLITSSTFLVEASPAQQDKHSVFPKVKEMLLIQRAETGDAEAQADVIRLANSGDPMAENALGDNYEHGIWVPKDHTQALHWYRRAARHGDSSARYTLGQMYFDGNGVKRDVEEAARWFGCPKPSESSLASCRAVTYNDLPVRARELLAKMKCEVRTGSNYDFGSAVDLGSDADRSYQFCCSESPHGPCGAVVIGRIGGVWKNLTPGLSVPGYDDACGGFIVLDSLHNGIHDVCLPNVCSTATPNSGTQCLPTILQFREGGYRSVPPHSIPAGK